MFGQLMLISGHAPTSLNSQPPFTAKHNEQCRIKSGEIVVIISDKAVESEVRVMSSVGIGWVHLGHLVKT